MIPSEKCPAVTRALREAFGVSDFDDIQRLTRGLSSALIFRILVGGSPYLLRIITRTDAISDPRRHFAAMRAAAEVGLAPQVWYTNIEDRIAITGFVEAVPFPRTDALVHLPAALRTLHALPLFPNAVNYFDAVDGFVRRFADANLLPVSETAAMLRHYPQLAAVYPRDRSGFVSCHNDLKPENILFDGRQVWLIDWEAAFPNDRYIDLAIASNFLIANDQDRHTFLQTYFDRAPSACETARFFLAQQILHVAYATVFLFLGAAGQPIPAADSVPDFDDFNRRIWEGEITLNEASTKVLYGRVHLDRLTRNLEDPYFPEALQLVAACG